MRKYGPALKKRFSPGAPFGLGLRLSARDAAELLDGHVSEFKAFLDDEGLYVAIINGFPYGAFHRTPVKAEVYAPDWRDPKRVEYTLDLIEILSALVPDDIDGGVSTAPLSYKAWMTAGTPVDREAILANLTAIADRLVEVRQDTGRLIHLDIEPEPDCVLETTEETIAFFTHELRPYAAARLAAATGGSVDQALAHLVDHLRVCFDCCHVAVEHEDPIVALHQLAAANIRVGRVQLSSALRVPVPDDSAGAEAIRNRLRPFADATYLHQVVARRAGDLRHFPDLDAALDATEDAAGREWRIHFHVPLFAHDYDGLGSTQDEVRRVLREARERPFTRHLEIETYTWDVLPGSLKVDLLDSIAREYEWVLGALGDHA